MRNNTILEAKSGALTRFAKEYGIRNYLTLGIIFKMLSDDSEILQKGIFLNDLTFITGEPVLFIGHDKLDDSTRLTCNGNEYRDTNKIIEIIQTCEKYYIYLIFPDTAPGYYLDMCEPNPYVQAAPSIKKLINEIAARHAFKDEFTKIYKEALMVLINSALEKRDKKQFQALVEEWKKIA